MNEKIAFIGFGEAGQTISRGLLGESRPGIRAYDLQFDSGNLKGAAEALGVGVARDHADAVIDSTRSASSPFTTIERNILIAQACPTSPETSSIFMPSAAARGASAAAPGPPMRQGTLCR